MAFMCFDAEECSALIKNGKLRFQARKFDGEGNVIEQVTISLPTELKDFFTQVINLDADSASPKVHDKFNRLKYFISGS